MSDLDARLRAAVTERSAGFEPSPDLLDRIDTRVRRRRRVRGLVSGTLVTAAAAAVVLVIALVGPQRGDEGTMWSTDNGDPTTTRGPTTVEESTTSSSASTTPGPPVGAAVDALTSQARHGIGPIQAGMTVRQAQEAAGVTIVATGEGSGSCVEARIDGTGEPFIVFLVEPAGPGADLLDGVVRAVSGSVLPTEEGIQVGQLRSELIDAVGQPTRIEDGEPSAGFPGDLLIYEADGFAYGVFVADDMVLNLQSGDPAWLSAAQGCPP
jgi:hypothetical protein